MRARLVAAVLFLVGIFCIAQQAQSQLTMTGVGGGFGGSAGSGWCSLVPQQANLTNCWPFDTAHTSGSTATDVIGGKNAALTSVTLNGSGPSTNLNNAGVFNGTSSNGQTTLANLSTSGFTASIWVNPNGFPIGNRFWANCHTGSDHNGFEFYTNGGLQGTFDTGNGTADTIVTPGGSPPSNSWGMYTLTYSGSTLTIYSNAANSVTGSLTGPVSGCATNIAFGFNPAYSGDFFHGMIAGAALWNTALTSGQITTLFGL